MIAFLDLNRLNRPYLDAFHKQLENTVLHDRVILGDAVEQFEQAWATYTGNRHAAGTGTGFDALYLIFEACKILGKLRPGDEVIVPANTYIASILPVVKAGLKPVAVEPRDDLLMHPADAEKLISRRTRVLLPVHLYGRMADMQAFRQLADDYGLLLIDDAAQAHGARWNGKPPGAYADATAWSFYPTKNLGALGDAGAVTSNEGELIELVKILRNYGQAEKYNSRYAGINSRLDSLQAAFLLEKLKDLDRLNRRRREIARYYERHLSRPDITKPPFKDDESHVYHQYVILTPDRDALREHLSRHGIQTLVHYPVPPHRQQALAGILEGEFPFTEQIHREIVSLPVDPYLTDEQLEYITAVIHAF